MKIIIKQVKDQPITKIDLFNKIATGSYFENFEQRTIEERINLVAKWQDLKPLEVEKMHAKTVNDIVEGIITTVNTYEAKAPRKTIGGLTHRSNYSTFTAGHCRHVEKCAFEKRPAEFMALFYIEPKYDYGHEEQNGGKTIVINPTSDRAKIIESKAKLSELIDLLSFFLNISELIKKRWVSDLRKQIEREKKKKRTKTQRFFYGY